MLEVHPIWSIVLLLGLFGWISSVVVFIYQAWDEEDNFHPRPAAMWGIAFVVFYAIWVAGLMNA